MEQYAHFFVIFIIYFVFIDAKFIVHHNAAKHFQPFECYRIQFKEGRKKKEKKREKALCFIGPRRRCRHITSPAYSINLATYTQCFIHKNHIPEREAEERVQ